MSSKICSNPKCSEYQWESKTEEEYCSKCGKKLKDTNEYYAGIKN